MKIDLKLPKEFANKWRRLLAYQDGDPEALVLSSIELLWDKYGRQVERDEEAHRRMLREGRNELRRSDRAIAKLRSRSKKDIHVFVGRYELTADSKGMFELPEELRFMAGGRYNILKRDGCIVIVPATLAEGDRLTIGRKGNFILPRKLFEVPLNNLILVGKIQYLEIKKGRK